MSTLAIAERAAVESGCIDADDPRHPGHPVTCRRRCCIELPLRRVGGLLPPAGPRPEGWREFADTSGAMVQQSLAGLS
jgi:hypothetical protein